MIHLQLRCLSRRSCQPLLQRRSGPTMGQTWRMPDLLKSCRLDQLKPFPLCHIRYRHPQHGVRPPLGSRNICPCDVLKSQVGFLTANALVRPDDPFFVALFHFEYVHATRLTTLTVHLRGSMNIFLPPLNCAILTHWYEFLLDI